MGGLAVPGNRLRIVLSNPSPGIIHLAKVEHPLGVAVLSGLAVPSRGPGRVLRPAEAALEQEELRHRRCSDECEPHRLLQQLVNVAERHRLLAADALASTLLER